MNVERIKVADLPPIPARVRCYPFHRPFAAMAVGLPDDLPVKPIETRGRPWGGKDPRPAWIAVYAAQRVVPLQPAALAALARAVTPELYQRWHDDVASRVIGMLYITGSRPLTPDDMPEAFFYAENKFAWLVSHAVRFHDPIKLAELGVFTPPQGFVYVPGERLRQALAAPAR